MKSVSVASVAIFAAVFALPALAQDFNLQAYGTLLPFVDSVQDKGATAAVPANKPNQVAPAAYTGANQQRRERITTGTSNFGFKGGYDFGEGFGVTFQIESAIPLDNDPTGAPAGNFANRDTYVGFASAKWGTIVLGSLDTPYKASTLQLAALRGINPFDYDAILENPGFAVAGTTTSARPGVGPPGSNAAFSRRQGNSLQYWTKKWNGLKGALGYSVDEAATRIDASHTTHPRVLSASIEYEIGPVVMRYAHEQHDDYFGMSSLGGSPAATATNPRAKDTGDKVYVRYTIAPTNTRLSVAAERLQYKNTGDTTAAAPDEYDRNAVFFIGSQKFLDTQNVWLSYGQATKGKCGIVGGGTCSTAGLGASLLTLGYIYNMTPRIDIYGAFYNVKNQESAQYSTIPAPSNTFAVAPGADTTGIGVGVLFNFGVELL